MYKCQTSIVLFCVTTSIYGIATSLNVVTTSLFCIMIINHCVFPYCMLTVQEYDAEGNQGNVIHMWSVLKVAPLNQTWVSASERRILKSTVMVGKMMGMGGCATGPGPTFRCHPGQADHRPASQVLRSPLFHKS